MSTEAEEGTLLARTRDLLRNTGESYLAIYKHTGLKPNWLSLLATGAIPDPSVNKVQALYEYLSAKKLPV
jgi:hypothetical protein